MWQKDIQGNWYLSSSTFESIEDNCCKWEKDEKGNWYVEKSHVLHIEGHG